jgi:putative Mg2+ transporter-C (MgtC) family protein
MIDLAFLAAYWSIGQLVASFTIILHLAGALALGLLVGYERSYHGRAAGMRTYGIVCMASAALTIIGAYPHAWYGAHVGDLVRPSVAAVMSAAGPDPTRIIQGIVTGIGFLGAGVIMREGFNISGLTTAASLWSSSVIGILIGIGFYPAAIMMALLVALSMIWIPRMEEWVPSRHAIAIVLRFAPGFIPDETRLRAAAMRRGYEIAGGSLAITTERGVAEWRFVALSRNKKSGTPLSRLATELATFEGVESFQLAHARN